jgi:hypothetical protein
LKHCRHEAKPVWPIRRQAIRHSLEESRRFAIAKTPYRLSIRPDAVFFTDELFSFRVVDADLQSQKSSIPVFIDRKSFLTAFGVVSGQSERFEVTRGFAGVYSHWLTTHTAIRINKP